MSPSPEYPSHARHGALLLVVLLLGVLTACGSSATAGPYRGDVLKPPFSLTTGDLAATFQSSQGGSTSLADLQRGHTMLLYFGYTHCPDVCPTTMAALGVALQSLPAKTRNKVQVVFVTSDPTRDTAPVMKAWLANFDAKPLRPFVGLTGPVARIDAVAKTLHILIAPPVTHKNGTVTVEHGAEVLAFHSGKAHLLWTADTPPKDYAHDLSKLLASEDG